VCRAANDWTAEKWLPRDDRLVTVISTPTADPAEAIKEIQRMADNPRFVAVLFAGNPLGRPLGDPLYHPIFAAAAEVGKPITVHPGTDRPNPLVGSVGGPPATAMEYVSQLTQQAMHYVSSLIVHGVFEKFPSLHFLIKEYGVTWLPTVMWRLDQQYDRLRCESPWVKKLPSEYIKQHIKLSTQPIEASPKFGGTAKLLSTIDGIEELLCFSTDFPHYSMDQPSYIARLLPQEWHRRVFLENACSIYGWSAPEEESA
jgi:predicted TIM-barrel fold metal-dependent hydrolase